MILGNDIGMVYTVNGRLVRRDVCPGPGNNKFLASGPDLYCSCFGTFNPGHSINLIGISKCRAESSHVLSWDSLPV